MFANLVEKTAMTAFRDALLAAPDAGAALDVIYEGIPGGAEGRKQAATELTALHNEGTIDVVKIFMSLNNKPREGHDFFLTRHALEQALPDLDAPVGPLMQCVQHLYQEAGQDMAAGQIIGSFRRFCEKDPKRAAEALQLIEADPSSCLALLPAVLAGGGQSDSPLYQTHTIRLIQHPRLDVRQTAVFAIGGITCTDSGAALSALEGASRREDDEHLLSNIVRSAYRVLRQDRSLAVRAAALIDSTLQKGGDQVLHAAADLFWLESKELLDHESVLFTLRKHLPRVSAKNTETVKVIDHGLAQHLEQPNPEPTIALLEGVLMAVGKVPFLDQFEGVSHALSGNHVLLSKLMTRWFLRGDPVLCRAIHDVVTQIHDESIELSVDASELVSRDPVHILFLARKAIGYLLLKPTTAASVIISLMRIAPEEVLPSLSSLLFDPILLNFPAIGPDYLAGQARNSSGQVRTAIEAAMAKIEKYLERLRAMGSIPELHPSNVQREAHHRHFSRLVQESYKQAQERSVFMKLVSKSVLLYGRTSINHVYGPDGTSHRTEIPLQSHGMTIDIPRMEQIDPFGMDYHLRVFRNERFRK